MSEVIDTPGTSIVIDGTPQASTHVAEPETFINPDGTYKEGWKEKLLPEELRNDKFYDSPFNANVNELLKTAGNQAKMLGKKGIIPINEKSSDFEIQEYRKAMGIPEKYEFKKPDLKMVDIPDEFINETLDKFNKMHFTQAQVDAAMESFTSYFKNMEEQYEREEVEKSTEINNKILAEENTNYETNSLYIDNAVRKFTQGWPEEDIMTLFGTSDTKDGINSKDHIELKPLLRRFLTEIGKSIGEGRMVTGDTGGKSLQEQLDEVMKSEDYLSNNNLKAHQEAINKALRLREQLNKQIGRV